MIFNSGYLTVKSATEVGSMLRYLMDHPGEERAFELKIAKEALALEADVTTLMIVAQPAPSVLVLANGQEMVRCRTKTGLAVDVLFGDVTERDFMPCYVFVESL